MAEHVWSVLCEKLLREDTGVVSLVSVVERINLHEDPKELESQLEGATGFIYPMRLMIWCVRSDYDQPETFGLRAKWQLPPDAPPITTKEHRVSLENATGVRSQMLLQGVPWHGPGLYWLAVEIQNEGEEWATVARLPVEVAVVLPQEPTPDTTA